MYSNSAYEFSNASSIPSSYTLKPAVEPVTSPLINGNPTFYTAASQTAPLTLSWTAATTNGGARLSGYTVVVYAVPSSGAWGNVIVKFFTAAPNTSITIPTGALSAGKYVFVIEADADGRADLSASPWRSSYPKGTAQIVSEPMTITGS
jgi:hypothetical protein